MKYADEWATGLLAMGFIMWAVFNHTNFTAFVKGVADNSVGLVSGIATVGR